MLFLTFRGTTAWFLAIEGFYVVCAAAVYWARRAAARSSCCACSARWPVRRPTAGAGVRYVAWALALAGPGLAWIVPVADRHWEMALLALSLFALLPLPGRRTGSWLRGQRPGDPGCSAFGSAVDAVGRRPRLVRRGHSGLCSPRPWACAPSAMT